MKHTGLTRNAWLGLVVLLFGLVAAQPVGAQSPEEEIRQLLEQRDRQIKSILEGDTTFTAEQRNELQTLINGLVDFDAMGRQALGPFWSDLTEEQRTEFVTVFRDIVRSQSLADLEIYNSAVTYDDITVEGDSAHVTTTTSYQGTSANVEYDLELKNDNWLAEDIIVDGVSTAESYARSFQTIIRKHGFEALMESLHRKREQIAANN